MGSCSLGVPGTGAARRAALGLGRVGSIAGNGSGDIFVAFSTADDSFGRADQVLVHRSVPNEEISALFGATVEAVEEAIVNALVAADGVLVPLQCEYFALEGISALVSTVRRIQIGTNPRLSIAGILLTMYDERTNLSKDVASGVRRHVAGGVYETIVPRNVRLAEAPSHGTPIFAYDIKSRGAEAYLALAREVLRRAA